MKNIQRLYNYKVLNLKIYTPFLIILLISPFGNLFAQLSGRITDAKGEPLPFANVYIEGTTHGTTANTEGYYSLDLTNGSYRIVFQYIGYIKKIESVDFNGKMTLDIRLGNSNMELSEFVVKANAEDPAYPIIRKAIEMRTTFRDQVPAYACDVYIKGVQKIVDAPKKFMGRDLGDMGGSLDTVTRSGIVYLSETISKLFVDGKNKKEELVSSKVSGNDNGFGFNRATLFDFSFYENNIQIARQILSPIADNALGYYKYRLIGTLKDKQGNDVYKIEVIPKRKEDPTFAGFIYIVDNQWNIYSTDLYVTGKSIQQPVLDTLYLRQAFVPIDKTWRLFSQNVTFKLGILGLKIKGDFTGVYSNYNLTPQYEKHFFNNEIFKASKGKDDNSLSKWDTLRPIPLTLEEGKDYVKKDSIQTIRQSKPYQDSVSKQRNKFRALNLFTGYSYNDLWNRRSFSVASPLSTFSFNAVQGGNINLLMTYDKRYGERFKPYQKSFSLTPSVSYGFAEKKLRTHITGTYLFNRFNYAQLTVEGGQNVSQFNDQNPVSHLVADLNSLYFKKHIYYIYDKTYAKVAYSQEVMNGLTLSGGFESAHRAPLSINTQFSIKKKEAVYNSNTPVNENQPLGIIWNKNQDVHIATIGLTWTPNQKYLTYPNFKSIEDSEYPSFTFRFQKAIPLSTNAVDFEKWHLKISKDAFKMGLMGYSEINAEFGSFLRKKNVHFIDYQHFNDSEILLSTQLNYMKGFVQLPYYQYSTPNGYLMAHWQHHFEGYFLDKIPLIRKLGFKEVLRAAYLETEDLHHYAEFGFGIDNIGWGIFRFVRTDLSWQVKDGVFNNKPKFLIGIKLLN